MTISPTRSGRSNKIKNRSTVSTGTGFEVDGYNSADSIYYSSLKLDNSSVSGIRPTVELLGSNGFYGSAGQVLKKDANNKITYTFPKSLPEETFLVKYPTVGVDGAQEVTVIKLNLNNEKFVLRRLFDVALDTWYLKIAVGITSYGGLIVLVI